MLHEFHELCFTNTYMATCRLQVRSVCKWEVLPPPLQPTASAGSSGQFGVAHEQEWQVLQLQRDTAGSLWRSPSLKAGWARSIRESLLKELAQNFQQG